MSEPDEDAAFSAAMQGVDRQLATIELAFPKGLKRFALATLRDALARLVAATTGTPKENAPT